MEAKTIERIAQLDDQHRRQGVVQASRCVYSLSKKDQIALVKMVREYDFEKEYSPRVRRREGSVLYRDEIFFWEINYYDLWMRCPSTDPSDPRVTYRKLTLRHCSE